MDILLQDFRDAFNVPALVLPIAILTLVAFRDAKGNIMIYEAGLANLLAKEFLCLVQIIKISHFVENLFTMWTQVLL